LLTGETLPPAQPDELGIPLEAKDTLAVVPPVSEKPGDTIDRYKLLEKIGEGGFGVVYVAEQKEPVKRRVALKIIKLGMDTKQVVARFAAERQALALMDHPNIAKVLDAGTTTTGRPFFVMELVRGIKLTEYCDQHKLSTKERLDLFIQVCRAIQHAHQKGIIHRDIKPSNILVTLHDGVPVPKVIDFGIAKATQGELTEQTVYTQFQQFIGTPAYMSPEQAEMSGLDIDTRSDIYALGVLLYELLTGKTPFDPKELMAAGLDQMRRTIREKEPVRPSTRLSAMFDEDLTAVAQHRQTDAPKLVHLIRGDLDWIVMKALEKDRSRRYETASGVAMDIQRHLNNEPVVARPPSAVYRLQKAFRRNKLAFSAAMAVATALVIGLGLSTWLFLKERGTRQRAETAEREQTRQRQVAEAEGNKARNEAAKSQQVAQFLQDMLQSVGPSVAQGRDTTMLQEILDKTAERVGKDLTNQPEVEAELRTTIGQVYQDLRQYDKAEDALRKALALRKKLPGGAPGVAVSLRNLGSVLVRDCRDSEARAMLEEALAINRKLLGDEHIEVANCLSELLIIVSETGTRAEADAMVRQLLAMQRKLLGPEHKNVLQSLEILAGVYATKGEMAEAEVTERETLAMYRKILGEGHPDTARSLYSLAYILFRQGKLVEAEAAAREALTMAQTYAGGDFNHFPEWWLDGLTQVLRAEGKLAEASALAKEQIAKSERPLNEGLASQPGRFDLLLARGYLYGRTGRWPEAVADLSRVVELWPNQPAFFWFLATALVKGGDFDGHRRLCVKIRERFGSKDTPDQAHLLAQACLMVPPSNPEDLVTGSRLADMGVRLYKGDFRLFAYQSCKALGDYRQGRFASAAEWASKALSQPQYATENEIRANCRRVQANMVLAMSTYKLGQRNETHEALARGLEIADTKLPKIESGDLGPYWPDWVFADVLMREAKGLIEGGAKEATTRGSSSLGRQAEVGTGRTN
jgi:serine/threonine protein kinase/tetratricopeptide (TPR) repeat protein